ncbi:MAG: hypothetical protein M0Q94_07740 [Candidatus Cloacimonetes bacterium]|nr:hypothetical protein [Candidatus Cloacimonadota bacterium]
MNPQIEQAARILEIKKAFDSSVAEMASAFSAAVSGDGITKESAEEWFKINLDSILETHRKSERAALGVPRYVVILSDSAGATGALPFRDRTDFTNWLEDKPFKISEIKGYGNLQEVDNRLVAVFSDSVAFIHPKYEDILEGRSQDMSRPIDSWKTASGGLTSYIEALAPEKWKTIMALEKPDAQWLRHHRNCNADWVEEVFSYEKDMCRIISQMKDNIEIVQVTEEAAKLISGCVISFKPEKFDQYLGTIVMRGSPFLFGRTTEIAILRKEEGFKLFIENVQHNGIRRSTYIDIKTDMLSDFDHLDFSQGEDTTRTEFGVENVEHFDSGIISEAVRYVVKYRLVSIAEKTPVQSCPCNRNGSRLRHGTRTIPAYRSVSLTKRYISGAREADYKDLDKEGKHIARVHVPGFIRQQAYGKQWSEHRTIWVDGFERGQWIRDGVIIRRVLP